MADDDRLPEKYRDQIENEDGAFPYSGLLAVDGCSRERCGYHRREIVEEMMTTTKSERTTRVIDFDQEGSMEQKT